MTSDELEERDRMIAAKNDHLEGLRNELIKQGEWAERVTAERDALRAQLAAERAAHALTRDTYATGAQQMAVVIASLRERIAAIVDAVKAERVARAADQDEDTRTTWDALRAAEKHTDAVCAGDADANSG